MIGINVPADMRVSPSEAASLGARWMRVVLLPQFDLTPWINDAHDQGIKILGLVARESLGQWSIEEAANEYLVRYGDLLDALQVGNESDHQSPSSWSLTASELNDILAVFRTFTCPIVCGGMVSGQPEYLDGVDMSLCDALAVHPYGQRADDEQDWSELPGNFGTVGALLDNYGRFGKDIWVTEVGVSTLECSEAFQARYCESMLNRLSERPDVPVAIWFCWSD